MIVAYNAEDYMMQSCNMAVDDGARRGGTCQMKPISALKATVLLHGYQNAGTADRSQRNRLNHIN